METLCAICALLALCLGNLPVSSGLPLKGPGYSEMLWCISAFGDSMIREQAIEHT